MKKSADQIFDELLVLKYREGDKKAMELLIKRWHQKIKRQLNRHTYEQEVAEDLAQEVWEAILKGIYNLREPALFGIWALRIATRKAVDWIRSNQRERKIEYPQLVESDGGDGEEDVVERLNLAMKKLPDQQRLILMMFYLEKHSVDEISAVLEVPSGTVKSRLFNARKQLKELLT